MTRIDRDKTEAAFAVAVFCLTMFGVFCYAQYEDSLAEQSLECTRAGMTWEVELRECVAHRSPPVIILPPIHLPSTRSQ